MQPHGDRPVIISFRLEHLFGWGVTFALCFVPVLLWLKLHPLSTIHTFPAIMLSLGRITGLVGMVMYALNLVYATRWRFLEYWFGGLNRVYIAHHMLGGMALILLTFHPLLLALRYAKSSMMQAALMLLPNGLVPFSALFDRTSDLHTVVLEQWAIVFGIISFWGMTALLLVTFFIRIPYRIWLFTHKFLGAAFFIGGLHVLFITSDTSSNPALKYYILGMTAIGLGAYTYKTIIGKNAIKKYRYRVDEVTVKAGNVTHVTMSARADRMPYVGGQFVFVRFTNAQDVGISHEWHPFSISSGPTDDKLRLSIKGLGDYTNKLGNLQSGAEAEIEGAYGRFNFKHTSNKHQVWIGGGIGITPFISMAKSLKDASPEYSIDLFYAVKSRSEIIDWTALHDAATTTGRLRIVPYIGDEQSGHLSADYIEKIVGPLPKKDFFICGPPPMMSGMRRQLRSKGVPGTSIHSEEFGMS